jgi:succinate dehydrogenase flavin-adding protein (antitoxin of CptAB toxin-antitoxin module)
MPNEIDKMSDVELIAWFMNNKENPDVYIGDSEHQHIMRKLQETLEKTAKKIRYIFEG